jgi:hypothetical protein
MTWPLNSRVAARRGIKWLIATRPALCTTQSMNSTCTRNNSEVIVEPDKQAMAFEQIRSSLEINPQGRLLLKGQEMVLLPRHFFRYILREGV